MPITATVNGTGTGAVSAATVPVPSLTQREVAVAPLLAASPDWLGKLSNRQDNDDIARASHQLVTGESIDQYNRNHPVGSPVDALIVASDWVREQTDLQSPESRQRLAAWRAAMYHLQTATRVHGSTVQTVMIPVWLSDP